jgi:hypothetical protein
MSLPVPPFDTPYSIELQVNLDDATDDRRRTVAEWWCCDHALGCWFRSVNKLTGTVRFSFEHDQDAIQFWLAN